MSLRTKTQTRFGYVLRYPTDLAIVSILAVIASFIVTSYPTGSYLRLTSTIALVLFLPGYGLVSLLFPARVRRPGSNAAEEPTRPGGIDTVERLGLAIALSLAIVPMVVIALPFTQWGLAMEPAVAALTLLTVGFAQLGVIRRLRLPREDRFTVSATAGLERVYPVGERRAVVFSSVILTGAVLAAVGMLLVSLVVPLAAGGFTEFAVYGENEDGERAAGATPGEIAPGDSIPFTIEIENHEGEAMNYTVVFQEQVIEDDEVVERTELHTLRAVINNGDGGTATADREVTPTADVNETVRISLLLFEGEEVPSEPTNEDADEDVYFWTTITEEPDDLEGTELEGDAADNDTEITDNGTDTVDNETEVDVDGVNETTDGDADAENETAVDDEEEDAEDGAEADDGEDAGAGAEADDDDDDGDDDDDDGGDPFGFSELFGDDDD